jgi:hypothetical protein
MVDRATVVPAYFARVGGSVTGLALVNLFTRPELLQPLQRYHLGQQQ